jgi:hypothetical protein
MRARLRSNINLKVPYDDDSVSEKNHIGPFRLMLDLKRARILKMCVSCKRNNYLCLKRCVSCIRNTHFLGCQIWSRTLNSCACAQNLSGHFWGVIQMPDLPDLLRSAGSRKWCHGRQVGPSLPHAPGARMTWVTQTPSKHVMCVLDCCCCLCFLSGTLGFGVFLIENHTRMTPDEPRKASRGFLQAVASSSLSMSPWRAMA